MVLPIRKEQVVLLHYACTRIDMSITYSHC